MVTSIELDDLNEKRKEKQMEGEQAEDPTNQTPDVRDGSVAVWAWASASLLAIISLPLLLFPRFLLFLSVSVDYSERSLTPLERFLSTHFAFFLIAIAITLVLYIPSEEPMIFEKRRRRDSLGHPLLGPLTGASLLSAFVSYNTKSVSTLSFVVFAFTSIIGIWGLWVALFEGTSRISRKTGADKHTSAFLFGNKSAASKQKKEWMKAQKST